MKMPKAIFVALIFLLVFIQFAEPKDDAKILYEKGEGKLKSADYKGAAESFREARSIDETLLDAWYGEGLSYYKMGQYKESNELCDQILRDSTSEANSLDRFAKLAGDSATDYERKYGEPLVNAGEENGRQIPEGYIEGLKYYDEAIKLNPNNTAAWNNKGIALAELRNYTGSIFCFKRAIETNSSLALAYSNEGASLDNMGNHTQALECYDNAIVLDPLLAEAWYNKAKTLALDLNQLSDAMKCFSNATKLNSGLKGEQLAWLYVDIESE
jgi:tetratricopeptide (TPR) repeat protein